MSNEPPHSCRFHPLKNHPPVHCRRTQRRHHPVMIISRTPFRISLFGGGTDFRSFSGNMANCHQRHHEPILLPLHSSPRPAFKHRYRASYSAPNPSCTRASFSILIRETLLMFEPQEGLEIAHVADCRAARGWGRHPVSRSGCSTPARLSQTPDNPEELARQAIEIERERVGDAGGWQDQYAAAFGGFRRIDFHRDGTVTRAPSFPLRVCGNWKTL